MASLAPAGTETKPPVVPPDWEAVLDQIEAGLAACGLAANGEGGWPPPYVVPAGLGPLPRELAGRAKAVLNQVRQMEDRVSVMRDGVVAGLARLERSRPSSAAPPVYVDKLA